MSDDTPVRPDDQTVVRKTPQPPAGPLTETTRPAGAAPGETFGPYLVLRTLGSGGMGTVFEAEETATGRRVALKVLSHAIDSEEMRKRFLREGRLAASISHPNTVYVFGAEEVDGLLTISMELVPGGTLQDRLDQRGPLPTGEAVDAILQVILGLDAAARAGILHRDVKPSNCFVDAGGAVKVGDFGLSVSVEARAATQLTTQGTFLGTPAYSSPEQLRGDALDARSDLYSVGVTLYHLLTGRLPFEADNMVKLLAVVLDAPPIPPERFLPALPKGLGRILLRCLEKKADRRPATYEELRKALLPYSSEAPTVATVGLRALAGALDCFLGALLQGGVLALAAGAISPMRQIVGASRGLIFHEVLISSAAWILFFGPSEGWTGRTLGKWIFGLKVTRAGRSSPGLARGCLRAIVFTMIPTLPQDIILLALPERSWAALSGVLGVLIFVSPFPLMALLFTTMRRRNGFAALQDLLTGTRVTAPSLETRRPALVFAAPRVEPATAQVGAYRCTGVLERLVDGEWRIGADPRLDRAVWIRTYRAADAPVSTRPPGRAGRLRWLHGQRGAAGSFDAYESSTGAPLLRLLDRPREWEEVRWWLLDLGEEVLAASKDGTLPAVLGLDRVQVTAEGRARLLDFPAPLAGTAPGPVIVPVEPGALPLFLAQAGRSALEGRAVPATEAAQGAPSAPIPLAAREWFEGLRSAPASASLESVRLLVHRPARVSWKRKLGLLAAVLVFPAFAFVMSVAVTDALHAAAEQNSDIDRLKNCLHLEKTYGRFADDATRAKGREFELYVAAKYKRLVTDQERWNSLYALVRLQDWERKEAERIVAEVPPPSEEEIRRAAAVVDRELRVPVIYLPPSPWSLEGLQGHVVIAWASLAGNIAIPALVCALLFRGGLLLLVFGVTFVRRDGARAGRGRVFARQALAWGPLFLGLPPVLHRGGGLNQLSSLAVLFAVLLAGALVSIRSTRGIADRLAGTWPVPR